MKKIHLFTAAILCIIFSNINAQEFNYLPAPNPDHQIINYTQFTLSYNEQHEQAEWVAYQLTRQEVEMQQVRSNCFKTDRNITTKSASKKDYTSTGFDLGHLAPAADNNLSKKTNKESFRMSNISPQLPGFNRGIWKKLETWTRQQAIVDSIIYVVTGPVFVNNLGTIGKNEVTIPGYFYKILLKQQDSKTITIAFLIPQIGAVGKIQDYIVPVNTIETLTGIDFFPELKNSQENKIESQYQAKKWGF
jgi:endonuclease G